MSESLWTAAQVARVLGVSTDWVYLQSRSGSIPTVALGRYKRYRPEAIRQWIAELEQGGESAPKRKAARSHALKSVRADSEFSQYGRSA
jgi:predicted DNA-binding transcriptional regulator AlpA